MQNVVPIQNQTEPAKLPRLAFSVNETAEALGIKPISVYRLINRGKLRASSVLRHKLIPVSEIQRLLAQ
ncbi:MAG: helix-turn-helix domain-containing protein [Verrucomicrobiota bacterium]